MNDKPKGQQLYVPRLRDPTEDLCILADCIAAADVNLFDQNGSVMLVDKGALLQVTPAVLLEITRTHVVTKQPADHGDGWKVERRPVIPDEMLLRTMLMARSREEGSLALRVSKLPKEPVQLNLHQQQEIRNRVRQGEPHDRIANAYHVDVGQIERLARL